MCMITAISLSVWAEGGATPVPAPVAAKHEAVSVRLPSAAFAALETINPENIRWHVRFLSHDLLEGRGTGQRGGDIAAEYIATQFAEYGLKPAGENGSYLQKVPLVGITTLPETQFTLIPKEGPAVNLKPLDEYVAYDQTQQAQSDVDAEIVYVGYGIEAPEYNWDDYKGVEVRGKVLLMLVNEPPSDDPKFFKGKALTYYGRWTYKYEEAARKGAVGVILIHREDMASYPWEVVRNSNSGEKSYLKLEGPALKVASWVQLDAAKKLAASSGLDLDKMMADARTREFHPVNLGAKLKAHIVSNVRHFESNNVVAMLPGSNRNLKDEAVMYTAHYDHLGIRPDMPGDNIYNGAADNATGCGILLELARRSLKNGRRSAFNRYWTAGTALGVLFLLGQGYAWRELASAGIFVATNPSSSFFYLLTAAHGLHILGGLTALVYVDVEALRLKLGPGKRTAVDVSAVFWHFVDGLWIFLMALFLVWG